MEDEPHNRLKALRIKRGFERAADAARAFGWPVTTYQAHENGSRGLKMDAAARYAKAYASTPAYILGISNLGTEAHTERSVQNVPLVGTVSAGVFRSDDGTYLEETMIPAISRPGIPATSQYAVLVDGPSVNLKIPDGAYAICAYYDSFPGGAQHGQLVHVARERAGLFEFTIKVLHFIRGGMILMPASNDPRFQDRIEMDENGDADSVTIKGIVIGAFQPL